MLINNIFGRSVTVQPHAFPLILFLTTIVISALFLTVLPAAYRENESTDYLTFYAPVAHNILNGEGLVRPGGSIATRYPPGYPLILSALFALGRLSNIPEQTVVLTFTLIGSGIISTLLFYISRQIWSTRLSLVAALTWASYPIFLWLIKQPNSEIPFLILLYAGVFSFFQASRNKVRTAHLLFLSGIFIGFAMLVRPIAIGLPLLLGISAWFINRGSDIRRRLFLSTIPILAALVIISPWQVWTYQQTGEFIMLSSGGIPSINDGLTFAVDSEGYRQDIQIPADVESQMQELLSLQQQGNLNSISELTYHFLAELQKRPLTIIKLFLLKAARSWYGTDSGRYETPLLFLQTAYIGAIALGGWVTWKTRPQSRHFLVLICPIALYFWVMTTLVLSIVRYMIPAMGLLFIFIPGLLLLPANRLARA